jgi:hypothetical protein
MTYRYFDTTWRGHSLRFVQVPFSGRNYIHEHYKSFAQHLQEGDSDRVVVGEIVNTVLIFTSEGANHKDIAGEFYQNFASDSFRGRWIESSV